MEKRHGALLALLVATGLFLTACGAADGSTNGNTPAVGAEEPADQPEVAQPTGQPEVEQPAEQLEVVRWTPSTDAAPAARAYPELADPVRPSLVFLYTAEPHTMPDGSEMI